MKFILINVLAEIWKFVSVKYELCTWRDDFTTPADTITSMHGWGVCNHFKANVYTPINCIVHKLSRDMTQLAHMMIGCWLVRLFYLAKILIYDNYRSHGNTSHCDWLLGKITFLYYSPEFHYIRYTQLLSPVRKRVHCYFSPQCTPDITM